LFVIKQILLLLSNHLFWIAVIIKHIARSFRIQEYAKQGTSVKQGASWFLEDFCLLGCNAV
jgi:hypothetical protein